MDHTYIKRYLAFLDESYKSSIEANKENDDFVKTISSRLELIRQISTQLDWQQLSPERKQASRLEWIASHKKRGSNVDRKEALIGLYSMIQSSLPHILVLNQNGRLEGFTRLCYEICEAIDFRGRAFDQVTSKDISSFHDALGEVNLLTHPLLQDSVKVVVETKTKIEEIFKLLS